jgi:IclR family acetate operon transcriptional repressor
MTIDTQIQYIGHPADEAMRADFVETAARGYVISKGEVVQGSTNIAAPVFEADGDPVAAVLISAPNDRVYEKEYERLGALVVSTARRISRGVGTLHVGEID